MHNKISVNYSKRGNNIATANYDTANLVTANGIIRVIYQKIHDKLTFK